MAGFGGVSGVSSGIQWRDMIDQIMSLEQQSVTAKRARATALTSRVTLWEQFRTRLTSLRDAATALSTGTALTAARATVTGTSGLLTASAAPGAQPGTHSVRIIETAQAERTAGSVFSSRTAALGIAGEFLINGARIQANATDSLDTIAQRINATSAAGVSATIASTPQGSRIVLSSLKTGRAGIDLVDGTAGALRQLGLVSVTHTMKHRTSAGFSSDAFADATTAVGTLRGLSAAPAGSMRIAASGTPIDVTVDLATMSLHDVAAAINTAAGRTIATITAAGAGQRLDIAGSATVSGIDDGGSAALRALGFLTSDRTATVHEVRGGVIAPSGTDTLLTALEGAGPESLRAGAELRFDITRGDGTRTTLTHTVAVDDTVATLLDRLNGPDGYAGSATASIDGSGRIVIAAAQAGASPLSLGIVATNTDGSAFDFGAFDVTSAGITRLLAAGTDAVVDVDGTRHVRATNEVSDVIAGVTLNLLRADTSTLTISVAGDTAQGVKAVQDLVTAYNSLSDLITSGVGKSGTARGLSADAVARGMRSMLVNALSASLPSGTNAFDRLGSIGVTVQRDGRFAVDSAVLETALRTDPQAVARLFSTRGTSTNSALSWIGSTPATQPGTWSVHLQAPARAPSFTSAPLPPYAGPLPARITVGEGAQTWSVELTAGMTASDVASALQSTLATPATHQLTGSQLFNTGGTAATESTLLTELHNGDDEPLFAVGGQVNLSGVNAAGSAFLATLEITAESTLGSLRAELAQQIGAGATVDIVDGHLTISASASGASPLDVAISVDHDGSTTTPFGELAITRQGRTASSLSVSETHGAITIAHATPGAGSTFTMAIDGATEAETGFTAGEYRGSNAVGTIGGIPAIGTGTTLTAAAGSGAEGLSIGWGSGVTSASGDVTFTRGIAAALASLAGTMLGAGDGSITSITQRLNDSAAAIETRADTMEQRIERRREELVKRFTAMERALAAAQSQSSWMAAQFNALSGQKQQ